MIKVNSKVIEGLENVTVAELLKELNYKTMYVAVEINNKIVPKSNYENTIISNGDVIEVVSFVGGGWLYAYTARNRIIVNRTSWRQYS